MSDSSDRAPAGAVTPAPRPLWLKVLIAALVVAALVAAWRLLPAKEWLGAALAWLTSLGPAGWVLFVLLYAIAVVVLLPASVLTIGAGAVYGPVVGVALVWAGAVLGSTLAFLLARTVLRRRIEGWVAAQPKFAAVDRAVAREGAKIVFLVRLSPLFPFSFTNYAFGLTGVRTIPYIVASAIGMLPGTIAYVLAGHAGKSVATGGGGAKTWLTVIAAVATLAVSIFVARIAKRAIDKAQQENPAG